MAVHFVRWDTDKLMIRKCRKLYEESGVFDIVEKGDLVAIKLHVGEYGNPNHIRPIFVKEIAERVTEKGGKPFITDSNTLYPGRRHNAVDHEHTAWSHGFAGIAPFVIADGLKGENVHTVDTKGILDRIDVSGAIAEADAMIVVSHVKGHGEAGMGAAVKNIGMGCCTPTGKMAQHTTVKIDVSEELCQGCGRCVKACFMNAVELEDEKIHINEELCMACGACVAACENEVLRMEGKENINEALASAAYGVLSTFDEGKVSYISFATNISTLCDCVSNPGPIVHPDLGVFASHSAVSIDAAVMNLLGEEFRDMHGVDALDQPRFLKKFGIKGQLEPEVVEL